MAKARALDKRRKSIRNIRKITRTMELIATARYRKAMDRATAATDFTHRVTQLVADLAQAGAEVKHPLLDQREKVERAVLLVLSANRGLCGGYNSSVAREAIKSYQVLEELPTTISLEVSGKRGINALRYRKIEMDQEYLHFDDQPAFEEVEVLANRYLDDFAAGRIDRLDVVYTRFINLARQEAITETLLPMGSLTDSEPTKQDATKQDSPKKDEAKSESMYEFLPSAESILAEVVPAAFRIKLFKCFLDAAVSEQIARMVAMKSATENAGDMIKKLSMTYNRARQSQITNEIMEIIGGAEALSG